jgi:hypothetical protein
MFPKQPEEAPKPTSGPGPIEQLPTTIPAAGCQGDDALGVNKYAAPADGRTELGGVPQRVFNNPFGHAPITDVGPNK